LAQPFIIQSGGGTQLRAFGDVLTVLLGGDQTRGALTVMLDVTPPRGGPPFHVHSREDELLLLKAALATSWMAVGWKSFEVARFSYRAAAHTATAMLEPHPANIGF